MTGYQCKRTNGQLLLDEGYVYLHGWKTQVKCQVQKFDFSGHADDPQIRELITKINPVHLILQHGDPENTMMVADWGATCHDMQGLCAEGRRYTRVLRIRYILFFFIILL